VPTYVILKTEKKILIWRQRLRGRGGGLCARGGEWLRGEGGRWWGGLEIPETGQRGLLR